MKKNMKFSCIIISETWFSKNQFLNSYYLDDYSLYCRSRFDGGGGGVCICIEGVGDQGGGRPADGFRGHLGSYV